MWQHILSKFEDIPTAKEYYDEDTQTLIILHNKEITFYIDGDEYKCEEGMTFDQLVNSYPSFYSIPDLRLYQQGGAYYMYKERGLNPSMYAIKNNDSYKTFPVISEPT